MSDVEFYRDHIDGLRSQLLLRDRKIEQLEAAVTRGVKLRAQMHLIAERLALVPASEITKVLDDMNKLLGETNE